jgi:hypothetical protein
MTMIAEGALSHHSQAHQPNAGQSGDASSGKWAFLSWQPVFIPTFPQLLVHSS